jgi:hypothetical protein
MPKPRVFRWFLWSALLGTALVGSLAFFLRSGERSVTAALRVINDEEAIAAVDQLYQQYPQPGITSYPAPAALARIAPKVRLTDEGAYLQTHEFFVEEDGIFILRSGSTFDPPKYGDPRFEQVRGRLFRYHISG